MLGIDLSDNTVNAVVDAHRDLLVGEVLALNGGSETESLAFLFRTHMPLLKSAAQAEAQANAQAEAPAAG